MKTIGNDLKDAIGLSIGGVRTWFQTHDLTRIVFRLPTEIRAITDVTRFTCFTAKSQMQVEGY